MGMNKVEYKGKTYKSLAELARDYNLEPDRVYIRLIHGWTLENAVETEIKKLEREVEYKGVKYPSIRELSDKMGFPYSVFCHHVNRYNNVDIAIEKTVESMKKEPIKAFGCEFQNYAEIEKKYGVARQRLIRQVERGNSVEDSIISLLQSDEILFRGQTYDRLIDLCAEYKIQPSNVYDRITHGFSLEYAVLQPIGIATNGISIAYRGKEYPSHISLCREYGISCDAVREIMRTHAPLSFIDVADCYVRMKEKAHISFDHQTFCIPRMIINGKIYNTASEFAKEVGMTSGSLFCACCKTGENDFIEQLKAVQAKTVVRYSIDGKIYTSGELKKSNSSYKMMKLAPHKIQHPMYESLQKFNFDDRCWDTKKIMFDFVAEYEELYEQANLNQGLEIQEM